MRIAAVACVLLGEFEEDAGARARAEANVEAEVEAEPTAAAPAPAPAPASAEEAPAPEGADMAAASEEPPAGTETGEGMNAAAQEGSVPGSDKMAATPAPAATEEGATETPPEIPEMNNEPPSSDSDSGSELGEIPVNETNPNPENTAAAPAATPAATPAAASKEVNALFSGGQHHFIHGMKKNKTHRHHKRRNRHHTLRKK